MTGPSLPRHPGLVPGSNGRPSEKLEPLVQRSRHFGSRHKAGMTMGVRTALGFGPNAGDCP